jgi:hypothetical protein
VWPQCEGSALRLEVGGLEVEGLGGVAEGFVDVWGVGLNGSVRGWGVGALLHLPAPDGDWHLEGHNFGFGMRFSASGCRQYFRQPPPNPTQLNHHQPPRLTNRQVLWPRERGGCGFAEVAAN